MLDSTILKLFLIFILSQKFGSETINNSLINEIIFDSKNLLIEKKDALSQKNDNKYKNFNFYKIDLSHLQNFKDENKYNFIKININIQNENNKNNQAPLQLYINNTLNDFMLLKEENELFMVDYYLNEKNPTIFLPKKYYEIKKYFYFFIQSELNTQYKYSIELTENENILIKGDNRFNILFKPGKIFIYYELAKNGIRTGFLAIGLLISGVLEEQNKLSVNAYCNKKKLNMIGKSYPYFINGVGTLVSSNELVQCHSKVILIEINNNLNKQVYTEFTTQYVYEKYSSLVIERKIYVNDIFTTIIPSDKGVRNNYKQCIEFIPVARGNIISTSYHLSVFSISSNLLITVLSNDDEEFVNGYMIEFSNVFNLKIGKNISSIKICFQNKNSYNAGLQFQIIEDADSYNILTQNAILPLINGFPNSASLNGETRMVYKVNLKAFYSSINSNRYRDKIIRYHLIIKDISEMKLYHLRCPIFKLKDSDNKKCKIIDNISYEINNNIYMSYNYKIENLLYYEEYALIKCNNNKNKVCNFQLEINVQDNYDTFPTQLFSKNNNVLNSKAEYYYKPIIKSSIDTYKITISNKLEIGTKIYFILYMFSGDADMAIYDYNNDNKMERVIQDAFYSSIGKKKLLLYQIKKLNENIYFREILLKITGISSGYYSVKYYILSEERKEKVGALPIREFNLEKISFYDNTKTYYINIQNNKNNFFDEIPYDYYITINTINCVIETSFMDSKIKGREMQILYDNQNMENNNNFDDDYNKLKISLKKLDSNNNNDYCLYYISSNPIGYKENQIIINEGIIYSMALSKKINSILYIYPYVYNGNIISISLYKYNKDDLKITVFISNYQKIYESTLKNINYKKIMIFLGTLEKYCKNIITSNHYKLTYIEENYVNHFDFCPIYIKVELPFDSNSYDDNYENHFKVNIFSSSQTPTYLKSNEIIFNSILVNQYMLNARKSENIYYYTNIGSEFPYEVSIYCKYGYVEAVAKIMARDDIDFLPTWNRKVRLPSMYDNDKRNYLEYNYESNKFIIGEEYRKKCVDGCELYISIFTRETSSYLQINDFSIILNKNNNKPINLIFNMEISDYLPKDISEKYYISKLENDNVDSLFFTFNSKFCKLCVIIIKNEEKEEDEVEDIDISDYKKNKCDWIFSNENDLNKKEYIFNINVNDGKLKGNKLTDIKLLSKIYTDNQKVNEANNSLYYSIKINKKQKDLPLIIKVDSTNNEMTILDKETGLGYYEIHLQDYQAINQLNIFVFSDELIINNNLILYAKIFTKDEYNKNGITKNEIQNILNSKNNNFEYKDYDITNFLSLNLGDKNDDRIILLVVKCFCMDKLSKFINHYIKIMTSYYKSSINTSIRSYNYKLYEVSSIRPVNFFIPLIRSKHSIIIINCIKGKGKIMIGQKYEIDINEDMQSNYKIVLDKNNKEDFSNVGIYNVEKNLDSNFLFYIYLLYENIVDYIYKISHQKINYIYYPNNENIMNQKYLYFYYDLSHLFEFKRKAYKSEFKLIAFEFQFPNKFFDYKNNIDDIKCSLANYKNIINKNINDNDDRNLIGDVFYNNVTGYIYIIFNINDSRINNQINNYIYKYILITIKNNFSNDKKNEYFHIRIKEVNNDNIYDIVNNCKIITKNSNYNYENIQEKKIENKKKIKDENIIKNDNNDAQNNFSISKKTIVLIVIFLAIVIILYMIRCFKKYKLISINEQYKKMNIETPIISH